MNGTGLHWLMLIPLLPIVMLLLSFWYFTCCNGHRVKIETFELLELRPILTLISVKLRKSRGVVISADHTLEECQR